MATVASLGLVTTDSSRGQRSWSAAGSVAVLSHHFDQTSRDISVCHIGEMDWVILLPDGNASRAD